MKWTVFSMPLVSNKYQGVVGQLIWVNHHTGAAAIEDYKGKVYDVNTVDCEEATPWQRLTFIVRKQLRCLKSRMTK